MITLDGLMKYIDSIDFFDTHSHLAGMDLGTPIADRAGQTALQLPALVIDGYAKSGFVLSVESAEKSKAFVNMDPKTHEAYLAFCDAVIDALAVSKPVLTQAVER